MGVMVELEGVLGVFLFLFKFFSMILFHSAILFSLEWTPLVYHNGTNGAIAEVHNELDYCGGGYFIFVITGEYGGVDHEYGFFNCFPCVVVLVERV